MMRVAIAFAILITPAVAAAQSVTIKLSDNTYQMLGDNAEIVERQLKTRIERQTSALVGDANIGEFLNLSANAQALVHKGLGADYAGVADGLLLGVGVGVAANGGDAELVLDDDRTVPVGAGAQLSLLVGYNFAASGLPELSLFVHGMGAPISFSEYDGNFYNIGANAQVQLVAARGQPAFRWGGVRVTSGVAVSRMRLSLPAEDVDFVAAAGGVRIQGNDQARLSLVQDAVSFPNELTTSFTLFEFLNVYGGIACDIDFGNANLELQVDTTITQGGSSEDGSAMASFDDAGISDRIRLRIIGGAQAQLGALNLFAQANTMTADGTLAVSGGTRVTF